MDYKIDIQGNGALVKYLDNFDKFTADVVEEEITRAGADVLALADSRVSVGKKFGGTLKQSGHQTTDYKGRETTTEVEYRTNYAAYVEFGTGGLVDVPAGLEDYAMQYKGAGIKQVNLPPRPFLFPAFFKVANELPDRINKAMKSGT
jgi:HK97 gp10 family phage protein